MIKTTTPSTLPSSIPHLDIYQLSIPEISDDMDVNDLSEEFEPHDFSLNCILSYSKSLEVLRSEQHVPLLQNRN